MTVGPYVIGCNGLWSKKNVFFSLVPKINFSGFKIYLKYNFSGFKIYDEYKKLVNVYKPDLIWKLEGQKVE